MTFLDRDATSTAYAGSAGPYNPGNVRLMALSTVITLLSVPSRGVIDVIRRTESEFHSFVPGFDMEVRHREDGKYKN